MYTIGEFSRIGKVSKKMLRHYDSIGLLLPAHVDPSTNYRYYSQSQVRDVLLINKLKRYMFSLKEIGEIIRLRDNMGIESYLNNKIEDIQNEIYRHANLLKEMQGEVNKIRKGIPIMEQSNYTIKVDMQPDQIVIASRQKASMKDLGKYIGECMEKVYRNGLQVAGPIIVKYYEKDFDPEYTEYEVRVPVNKELYGITHNHKGHLCVHTQHIGPYSELGFAYAAINDYVVKYNHISSSAPYDVYLTAPGKESAISKQITEVYFPIKEC